MESIGPIAKKIFMIFNSDHPIHVWGYSLKKNGQRNQSEQSEEILRQLLARYLNEEPTSLVLLKSDLGKPYLYEKSLEFNLSHSGTLLFIAVSDRKKVGVDVQEMRPVEAVALARRYFSSQEADLIEMISADKKLEEFYRLWTKKEALAKAKGQTLAKNLRSSSEVNWSVANISAPVGYRAALAMFGEWRDPQIYLQDC